MISLQILHEQNVIKVKPLSEGVWTLGSNDKNDVIVKYPTVSNKHALIEIENNNFYITDCNSKNGIFLKQNNSTIRIKSKEKIKENEIFLIGPFECKLFSNRFIESELKNSSDLTKYIEKYLIFFRENSDTALERLSLYFNDDINFNQNILNTIKQEFEDNGPLTQNLNSEHCKEIIINKYNEIYVDIGEGLQRSEHNFISNFTFENWVYRTVQKIGKRLDLQAPICEGSLENGARFHAVIPPISNKSINVSIRKFGSAPISIENAIKQNWISKRQLNLIKYLVENKFNCIISGGTSSGKTSLLNFMCQFFNINERIITIEDTVELTPRHENTVQLVSRKSNSDGIGEISIRKLIQSSLRMRPDRIIVGECRGDEVIEMLQALNTGHPGSITTIHANSTHEAIHRIELMCLLNTPNITVEALRAWIYNSIDAFIHLSKDSMGNRKVSQISITKNSIQKIDNKDNFKFQNASGLYNYES